MAYFPQFTYPNGSQTHYGYPRLTLAGGYKYGVFSSVKPDHGEMVYALNNYDNLTITSNSLVVIGNRCERKITLSFAPNFAGSAILIDGSATILSSFVTADSRIFVTRKDKGGDVNDTVMYLATVNDPPLTFTINATKNNGDDINTNDESVVNWFIVN
jgi:hypothetical protein|tara:strand:+ start:171 stop:644 length:474 start_codon:yes stop_codon:yes gene_type:complete